MSVEIKAKLRKIEKELLGDTQLLAVSKTKPLEMIKELYGHGQINFGENKVQDLLEKSKSLSDLGIQWHFIGSLQSNKINNLLLCPNLVSIHSIDSIKLLNKLLSKKTDRRIGLFIQMNTSGEAEKSGFTSFEEVCEAIELIQLNNSFFFQGLMTIGKIRTSDFEAEAEKSFRLLESLKEKIEEKYSIACELSMGMSQDYKIAMKYKSDWIRVGSSIFGKRDE